MKPIDVRRLIVVGLGTLVVPLDTMVNVAFPAIVAQFGIALPEIQWVVIGYMLAQTSLMLVFGRLGDMLGYRRVFLIGAAASAASFVFCATAASYAWLLAARVAQGVGAGLILSVGPALATSLFAERHRARVLGLYTMMFGIGQALGPVLGGVLVAAFGWTGVFWSRAPLALLCCILVLRLPTPRRAEAREPFDGWGAALLVIAISAAVLALNQVRHLAVAWPLAAACGGVAVAGVMLFLRQERRAAKPIIDLRFFRTPGFSFINAANALVTMSWFSVLLIVPFFLARQTGLSAPLAGLVLGASPAGAMLASPIAGQLAGRFPPPALAFAGMVMLAAGLLGVGLTEAGPGLLAMLMSLALAGIGQGLFQVAYFDVVTGTLPPGDRGVAGSLGMVTRTLGVVLGATLLMLIFETARALGLRGGEDAAFIGAFRATFLLAGAVPLMLAGAMLAGRRFSRA